MRLKISETGRGGMTAHNIVLPALIVLHCKLLFAHTVSGQARLPEEWLTDRFYDQFMNNNGYLNPYEACIYNIDLTEFHPGHDVKLHPHRVMSRA